jgi:hypothetical protein
MHNHTEAKPTQKEKLYKHRPSEAWFPRYGLLGIEENGPTCI